MFSSLSGNMEKIYSEYCDIMSSDGATGKVKAPLAVLSAFAESQGITGHAAIDGLCRLKSQLNSDLLDARGFALFYRFVFFMCRERGQKSIFVRTGIEAWRLVLAGRFRLLDQWCEFVKKHQRHNISEDTWLQVLEFSRVVHEDLSNYDPEGAWPVLIDEFVEHMYRNSCSSTACTSDGFSHRSDNLLNSISNDLHGMSMSNKSCLLPGMNVSTGFKRRWSPPAIDVAEMESVNCISQRLAKMSSPLCPKRVRSSNYTSEVSDKMEGVALQTGQAICQSLELSDQLNIEPLSVAYNCSQGIFNASCCKNTEELQSSPWISPPILPRTEQFQLHTFGIRAATCGMHPFASKS